LQKVNGRHYWELPDEKKRIPQVILTDNYLQGIYGYAVGDDDPGVLLLSYSWEDDTGKLVAGMTEQFPSSGQLSDNSKNILKKITSMGSSPKEVLAWMELFKLDFMLERAGKESILIYLDWPELPKPKIHFWSEQRNYRTCAKLYHPHSEALNLATLSHNENYAEKSGLYFAGESYSVEGGWLEPALRSAIDATIHFSAHWKKKSGTTVTFKSGFDPAVDYPSWNALRP
jgi:tryptophan 2-monooxygenase